MSHWFHRNPIKGTLPIDFVKRTYPSSADASTIVTLLRKHRDALLRLHNDPANLVDTVQAELVSYVSLLMGFIHDCSAENMTADSKLRFAIKSKWSQSLGTNFV